MIQALGKALGQFDDPKIQRIVWKSLAGRGGGLRAAWPWCCGFWPAGSPPAFPIGSSGSPSSAPLSLTVALDWFLFPVAVTAIVGLFLEASPRRRGALLPRAGRRPASRALPAMLWGGLRFAASQCC